MERITAAEFRRREGLAPTVATDIKPQIRLPRTRQPNKTEAEWMEHAARLHPGRTVLFEPFTLHIPSGRYTPDVVVITGAMVVVIYEVKGPHIHNSASVRAFKEARAAFPFWHFVFCQKTKGGWATT